MSGGSMDYICFRVEEASRMCEDAELSELLSDAAKVLHDEEWWRSADCTEDEYRESIAKFKEKWFACRKQPSGEIMKLIFECPECRKRIFLANPDPFEMLSLHQSCMHWTCPECGEPIDLTSEDILVMEYGNPVTYTGETAVRHPIVSENRGGMWRDVGRIVNAVRDAVRKAVRRL